MTIIGFMIYILAAVGYIVAIAFPSVSANNGIVAAVSHLLWNEPLRRSHIIGLLLIGTGVAVVNDWWNPLEHFQKKARIVLITRSIISSVS